MWGCGSGRGAAFGFTPTRSEPCGFGATYEELASAVREEYPDIEIESRLGGTGELRGGRLRGLRGGSGCSRGSRGVCVCACPPWCCPDSQPHLLGGAGTDPVPTRPRGWGVVGWGSYLTP